MEQNLPRVPKDRIAPLIGAKGATRRKLQEAAGCKHIDIDSETGDVTAIWPDPGTYDPIKALKLPNVIKAIGRGMAPNKAISLLDDRQYFELVDLRDYVGKRGKQLSRVRARIIGTKGKIREKIESLTDCELTIYKSTVVIIGEEDGISLAAYAVQRLAGGAEHGSVLHQLEKNRKSMRMEAKALDYYEIKQTLSETPSSFAGLVPDLDKARDRRERRLKAAQVDPSDEEAVDEMMGLADDESISWQEE